MRPNPLDIVPAVFSFSSSDSSWQSQGHHRRSISCVCSRPSAYPSLLPFLIVLAILFAFWEHMILLVLPSCNSRPSSIVNILSRCFPAICLQIPKHSQYLDLKTGNLRPLDMTRKPHNTRNATARPTAEVLCGRMSMTVSDRHRS